MIIFKYIYYLVKKAGRPLNGSGLPVLTGFTIGIFLMAIPAQAMLPQGATISFLNAVKEDPKLKKKEDQVDINLKKKDQKKDEFDEFEEENNSLGFQFILTGFVELENFISTYLDQEPEDIVKKNEFRVKLNMQLGNENYYFKCTPNLYFLPFFLSKGLYNDYTYSDEEITISRNGRISGKHYELSFNECYLNVGFEHFRLRFGNQIYAWGTADYFNPTSYINPADFRELFYKDPDEIKLGVPSLSSMIFIQDFTIEFVFVPFQVGAISPLSSAFWSYDYSYHFAKVIEAESEPLPPAGENLGYGLRASGSVKGVDFALSFYHGPDAEPMLRPVAFIVNSSGSYIMVKQEYRTSTNIGADISFKLWKFELHGEITYSPNKYGVVDQREKNMEPSDMVWPWKIKPDHYLSYALGLNFIWKDLLFVTEWVQSTYFDKSMMVPYYTHFLAMMVSYGFLEDLVRLSFQAILDVKNVGSIITPRIDFDIHNGVTIKIAYSFLAYKPNDEINMFTLYDKNDIFILGVRYEF